MGNTASHADQKYIEALVQNDSRLMTEIYQKFAPKVMNYIKNNYGNAAQTQDVIQETLIIIYKQATEKSFVLTCPFDAYFFLLCKRKWLNELEKSRKVETINEEIAPISDSSSELADATELFATKNALFMEMFAQLDDSCKQFLKETVTIKSMEEVATKLRKSYGYVRKRKSLCVGQLTEMIRYSPKYQQLINNDEGRRKI